MSCWDTIGDYAFRSIGFGERLLPRTDFTLCQQFTLIGSGVIWNVYFGILALAAGFFFVSTADDAVAFFFSLGLTAPMVGGPIRSDPVRL